MRDRMRIIPGCSRLCLCAALLIPINAAQQTGTIKTTGNKNGSSVQKSKQQPVPSTKDSFVTGLLSGAVAGTTVDLVLYPLDTVKTRLQATAGDRLT